MSVSMLYQTVRILVTFFYCLVQKITQKLVVVKLKFIFSFTLGMKRLISSCQAIIQYTTCTFVFEYF